MVFYLLVDFGATNTKSAIVNLRTGEFSNIKQINPPLNISKYKGHYELSIKELQKQFHSICQDYYKKIKFEGIAISCQMHGFALSDLNSKFITNYISWKDERSMEKINGQDSFSILDEKLEKNFKEITGMKLRPSLPVVNAFHIVRSLKLKGKYKILTLADLFSMISQDFINLGHPTMLAGLGIYDINKKETSIKIMKLIKKLTNCEFSINSSYETGNISGYWHTKKDDKIPIYSGVGDHQCAVLGACNQPEKTLSLNLGTGSQVSLIKRKIKKNLKVEYRPYFDSMVLATLTHIPSGRALNEYFNIIQPLNKRKSNIWNLLKKFSKEDILKSTLKFDLNVFKSAKNYTSGGSISFIHEGELELKNYLCSLLNSFIRQYLYFVNIIDPMKKIQTYILSGGIPQKLPVIKQVFSKITNKEVLNPTLLDETFLGLRTILLSYKNNQSHISTQEKFKRKSRISKNI